MKTFVALIAMLGAATAIADPPSRSAQARIGTLLSGKPIRILDTERSSYDRRGTLTRARVRGCNLTLVNAGLEPISLTVPLGDLRYVQGVPGMIEITRVASGSPSIIVTVGEAGYDEAIRLLTQAATGCGSRLIGPPPLVTTR